MNPQEFFIYIVLFIIFFFLFRYLAKFFIYLADTLGLSDWLIRRRSVYRTHSGYLRRRL